MTNELVGEKRDELAKKENKLVRKEGPIYMTAKRRKLSKKQFVKKD